VGLASPQIKHGSGRDRSMLILLIPSGAERAPLASGEMVGRSPEAIRRRILARSSWCSTLRRRARRRPQSVSQYSCVVAEGHNQGRPRIGRIPDTPDCKLCWTRSSLTSCSHIYLAVPIIGTSRTHSPSSGTGISSCQCRTIRCSKPRRRATSRSGVGSRSDTGGSDARARSQEMGRVVSGQARRPR